MDVSWEPVQHVLRKLRLWSLKALKLCSEIIMAKYFLQIFSMMNPKAKALLTNVCLLFLRNLEKILTKYLNLCTIFVESICEKIKISKFQNEFIKSSSLPKCQPKIARISALYCVCHTTVQKSLQFLVDILGEMMTT